MLLSEEARTIAWLEKKLRSEECRGIEINRCIKPQHFQPRHEHDPPNEWKIRVLLKRIPLELTTAFVGDNLMEAFKVARRFDQKEFIDTLATKVIQ